MKKEYLKPEILTGGSTLLLGVDLSFGGIVSAIQNDRQKGMELLETIVKAIEEGEARADKLDFELKKMQGDIAHFKYGLQNVLKHLKMELPVGLLIDKKAYTVWPECEIQSMPLVNAG